MYVSCGHFDYNIYVLLLILIIDMCNTGLTCEWTDVTGSKLEPLITGDPEAVTVSTLNECKQKCVEESSFICAAVNYRHHDRRCELLEENDQTAQPQGNEPNWNYSLRPICAGECSDVSHPVYAVSWALQYSVPTIV